MSDVETWLADARSGNRDTFDKLFRHFQAKIRRFCEKRMSAQTQIYVDVEDVMQETALRAYQSLDKVQWQGEAALCNWFFGIALNVIYAHYRRFMRLGPIGATDDQQADEFGVSPSRDALREERLTRLESSLDKLTPDQREVVSLIRLQGLTVREAAASMKRTEKATYQLLWRAMQQLRELFGDTQSLHLPPNANLPGKAPKA